MRSDPVFQVRQAAQGQFAIRASVVGIPIPIDRLSAGGGPGTLLRHISVMCRKARRKRVAARNRHCTVPAHLCSRRLQVPTISPLPCTAGVAIHRAGVRCRVLCRYRSCHVLQVAHVGVVVVHQVQDPVLRRRSHSDGAIRAPCRSGWLVDVSPGRQPHAVAA